MPSLSRAPAFAGNRKQESGSVKDQMESGYVATRPRFTRLRRTFTVPYHNLNEEDYRALDLFESLTVFGDAGAFWYPNILPNGSFEQPVPELGGILGWRMAPAAGWAIKSSSTAADGCVAVSFSTSQAQGAGTLSASIVSREEFKVAAGDVYQVAASVNLASTYAAGAVTLSLQLFLVYTDHTVETVSVPLATAATTGYVAEVASVTIPASGSGATAAIAQASFVATLAAGAGTGESATVLLDSVGLALTSAAQPYGRLPGSQPLGTLVRFSKQPEWSDAGWSAQQKRYNVTFDITEV